MAFKLIGRQQRGAGVPIRGVRLRVKKRESGSAQAYLVLGTDIQSTLDLSAGDRVEVLRDGNRVLLRPTSDDNAIAFKVSRHGNSNSAVRVTVSALTPERTLPTDDCDYEFAEGGVIITLPEAACGQQDAA